MLDFQRPDRPEIPSRRDFVLDPRSVFLFQDVSRVFLWVGSKCANDHRELYLKCAIGTLEKLRAFEDSTDSYTIISEGHETSEFLQMLKCSIDSINDFTKVNKNWSNWFLNLEEDSKVCSARSHKSTLVYAEREEIRLKPALFVFPYYTEPLFLLDLDDLTEDIFAILCDKEANLCFIWRGAMFDEEVRPDTLTPQEFVDLSLRQFYETEDFSSIEFVFESSAEESERFLRYFS